MLQKVINYQYAILQTKTNEQVEVLKPNVTNSRFTQWNLQDSIRKIPHFQEYSIIWLGNDRFASILSFFYCVASGSFQGCKKKDEVFTKLKYNLYQLSENHLSVSQQKLFVQYLCLLQYSKDIGEFLRKNQVFEDLLGKIFTSFKEKSITTDTIYDSIQRMEEIKFYSNIFDFIEFSLHDEEIGKIKIKNFTFYIISEKQCFFILQKKSKSPLKKCFSELDQKNIYKTMIKSSKKKKNKIENSSSSRQNTSPFSQDHTTPKFHITNSPKNYYFNGVPRIQEVMIQAFRQQSQEQLDKKEERKKKFEKENKFNSVEYLPKTKYIETKILTDQSTKNKLNKALQETIKKIHLPSKQLFNSKMKVLQLKQKNNNIFQEGYSIRNTVPQVNIPKRRVPKFLLQKKIAKNIRINKTFPKLIPKKLNNKEVPIYYPHIIKMNKQINQANIQNISHSIPNPYLMELNKR